MEHGIFILYTHKIGSIFITDVHCIEKARNSHKFDKISNNRKRPIFSNFNFNKSVLNMTPPLFGVVSKPPDFIEAFL
jgi:hypothetical protein